jgi:hypothetical protein
MRKLPPITAWWYCCDWPCARRSFNESRSFAIARDRHAGVARGAEVLRREERERADRRDRPGDAAARVARPDRLAGVFEDRDPVGPLQQRIEVGRVSEEMHRHDARQAVAPHARELRDVEPEVQRLDVREHRHGAGARDRPRRREERERRGQHAVAALDAERHQPGEQRVGAARHTDGEGAVEFGGDGGLERVDLAAEDELLVFEDAQGGRAPVGGERRRRAGHVHEGNGHEADSLRPAPSARYRRAQEPHA